MPNKKSNNAHRAGLSQRQEDDLIARIDFVTHCSEALETLQKLIGKKGFCEDLQQQKDAQKVIRGMAVKMQALHLISAAEIGNSQKVFSIAVAVAAQNEGLFREQMVKLQADIGKDSLAALLEAIDGRTRGLPSAGHRSPGGQVDATK